MGLVWSKSYLRTTVYKTIKLVFSKIIKVHLSIFLKSKDLVYVLKVGTIGIQTHNLEI